MRAEGSAQSADAQLVRENCFGQKEVGLVELITPKVCERWFWFRQEVFFCGPRVLVAFCVVRSLATSKFPTLWSTVFSLQKLAWSHGA